jgi:hypothetical protein
MGPTRSSMVARCVATMLLVVFAAACGGGAGSSSAGAQGSTGAIVAGATAPGQAQGQQGGAGSVNDGLGHTVNVCTLLPVATVASITGEPLTVATEQDTLPTKTYVCDYTSSDGTYAVLITVAAMAAAIGYDADLSSTSQVTTAKQISGLGDKAFSGPLGLEALFGNVSITVSNLQSDAAAGTLIRTLQPKL